VDTQTLWLAAALWALTATCAAAEVKLSVNADEAVGTVDERVYGHFLEHIYHSVNGGLWGEMVWDRSFEPGGGARDVWSVEDDSVVQRGLADNCRLLFGDLAWKDYEYTLQARKLDGREGFLIIFRAASADDFYWVNFGGWGNVNHGIERGVAGQGRWRAVTTTPGKIDADHWYSIRVRCEGPRIRVFLDDREVFDFTDKEHPHLGGRVGVGTWGTAAQYRNLKVSSLEGRVLFSGLPPGVGRNSIAGGWSAYGPGLVNLSREKPLNGDFCQSIEPRGGETGVAQTPFCVRAGEGYTGSVWARGDTGGQVVVRLVDGERTLAQAVAGSPGAEWAELAFRLTPEGSADSATLQVGVTGAGVVCLDQVSLMPEAAVRVGGFRPDLLQAVAELQPPVIRWPGGCFAEYYLWKDGIGPQAKRVKYPISIWDDQDTNSYGTDEFIAMCRRVGAEPLLVINIGRHDARVSREEMVRYAQQWVEYCNGRADSEWGKVRAANGHPEPYGVKYWEIDNETWRMGVEEYVKAVREFAPALKQVDPGIQIAACGSGGMNLEWNRGIIEGCGELVDLLSIHHYENPDNYATGPGRYERFFVETGKLIAASRNPKMKIFISEWNAQSTDWRTGLYAAGLLNSFERVEAVGMAAPALFLRHVSATDWDNAFINFDQRGWFPAPNYVVMKLYREHFEPVRLGLEGDPGALNAVATRSEDGRRLVLKAVNPSPEPLSVCLEVVPSSAWARADLQIVAPGDLKARNSLDDPNFIAPRQGRARFSADGVRFALPPLSVGVLSLERD
jgi:alpha-N-arabinofuranosidase